jgi:hypothetical protein
VLQDETRSFLEQSLAKTFSDGDALISAVEGVPGLSDNVRSFRQLDREERIQVMQQVFKLEVQSSGLTAPELVLDDGAKRETFFEFDPSRSGPGRVVLNPRLLFADSNPDAALLFLIHETRHSYQFQVAFASGGEASPVLASAYRSGFQAQRQIFDLPLRPSFCDFLTLNQEYEAFLFGNYVLEKLTSGRVDISGMGTLASQYLLGQGLQLNLPELALQTRPGGLLDAFNELEKQQYRVSHLQQKSP